MDALPFTDVPFYGPRLIFATLSDASNAEAAKRAVSVG